MTKDITVEATITLATLSTTFLSDTLEEVSLKFPTKQQAIEYAKKNNISYKIINPKKKEFIIKSYADNFLKN